MHSSKVVEITDKLHQKFSKLEQEWLFYKQYRTRKRYHHDHGHDHPTNQSNFMVKTLTLLDNNSPRNLMSSLQSGPSPSEGAAWKVIKGTTDSAVKEMIRERREAIKGGALKGRRRLFGVALGEVEGGRTSIMPGCGNDYWNHIGMVQESNHEERSVLSFDESDEENDNYSVESREISVCFQGYSCSLSVQKVEEEEKIKEREQIKARMHEEKRVNVNRKRSLVTIMRCLALASVIFAIFIIRIFGQNDGQDKVILVPT